MNKFVYRILCRNYEQSSRELLAEMRRVKSQIVLVNREIFEQFQESLKMLRLFLDNNGVPMPKPKWHYDDKDESTWLFTHRKGVNKTFLMLRGPKT